MENIPQLLAKNQRLQLTGSWKSELGVQDQYGTYILLI